MQVVHIPGTPTHVYHNQIHLLNYPAWIFNEKTLTIIDANKQAIEFCMYDHHELIGLKITELWHGADFENILNDLEIHSNERSFFGFLKHRKKNGDIVDIRIRATRILNPKTAWVVHLVPRIGTY